MLPKTVVDRTSREIKINTVCNKHARMRDDTEEVIMRVRVRVRVWFRVRVRRLGVPHPLEFQ